MGQVVSLKARGCRSCAQKARHMCVVALWRLTRTHTTHASPGAQLMLEPPGLVERINAALPPAVRSLAPGSSTRDVARRLFVCSLSQALTRGRRFAHPHPHNAACVPFQFRVFGVTRVTNGFNAKKLCDRRRYKYILPEWAFDPSTPLSSSAAAAAAAAAHVSDAPAAPPPFRLDDAGLARLNGLLGRFVGTHNFHNYTVRVRADDPAAKRYILAFAASPPCEAHGARLVTLQVLGQSFMLHQIRKMVGTALAIMRGALPEDHLAKALAARDNVVRASLRRAA
jgi:tRNA pseudouridine(38-40) synthase